MSNTDSPLSIVRIKRKLHASTNGGPPQAGTSAPAPPERTGPEALMLAEPSRKRTRISSSPAHFSQTPPAPFFTFAETVPVSSFESPGLTSALRERLKTLASTRPQSPPEAGPSTSRADASTESGQQQQRERYRVIGKTRGQEFDLVDVDIDTAGTGVGQVRKRRKAGNARTRQSEQQEAAEREQMEQFNDLLREYLSFDAAKPFVKADAHTQTAPATSAGLSSEETADDSDSDGDYVYDIYYKTAPTAQAFVPDSYAEVTGLDVSDLENISSDSDVVDGEVDPDSNDEGFYANDYPDEEDMGGLSEELSSDLESDSADDSDWER